MDARGIPELVRLTMLSTGAASQQRRAAHTTCGDPRMGFLSNGHDRSLMLNHGDGVALAIVNGIQRFLDEVPRTKIFGEDLIVAPQRGRASPSPTP